MCFDLPYKFKKGKIIDVRKRGGEESEEIGLLVKEIDKWNKKKEIGVNEGERGCDAVHPSNHKSC